MNGSDVTPAMSPALESNAGDRYHFVYAARRLMDLLYPGAGLRRVVLEGIAPTDAEGESADTYLGVDLTEYFGGDTLETADTLAIVQVKYSPKHPTHAWTLARLVEPARRKTKPRKAKPRKIKPPDPSTSIIGKLATAYNAIRQKAPTVTVRVEIVSNQPIAEADRAAFTRVKAWHAEATVTETALEETDLVWLARLRAATGLDDAAFRAFLDALSFHGFDSDALSAAEGRLFSTLDTFLSNGDLHVDGLISFVQERALPDRTATIDKADLLRQLRLHEDDFAPAPNRLDVPDKLFPTRDAAAVAAAVASAPSGIIVSHGLAGIGKTSALQLLARDHADVADVVIFDCFGGGTGVQAGRERFPFRKFFTQVTNDLDAAFHTSVFATTRLDRDPLLRQFHRALDAAAKVAGGRGRRLVLAIDAIDNAVAAAAQTPLLQNESFVPLLGRIAWPANVVVVCTARTENVETLPFAPTATVELLGFVRAETHRHAEALLPSLSGANVDLLHDRTRGTARVQARILEALADVSEDAAAVIQERAQESAFAFYREEAPSRLRRAADREALALLVETTQPIDLRTWAEVAGRDVAELSALRSSLAFGLRMDGEQIVWRDQEFWDFLREHLATNAVGARRALADFCAREIDHSAYARANFSRHLHNAGDFDALIDYWLGDDRLEKVIRATNPHDDLVGKDIGYALLAAQERRRRTDVLRLLTLAADVAQGRNVFTDAAARYAAATVAEHFDDRVLTSLGAGDQTASVARSYLRFAAETIDADRAWDLIERGEAIVRQESGMHGSRGFQLDDVRHIATAEVRFAGIEDALAQLGRWRPQSSVASAYREIGAAHATAEIVDRVLQALPSIEDDGGRAFAVLGLLAHAELLPSGTDVIGLSNLALAAPIEERFDRAPAVLHVLDAIEALVHAGHREAAMVLLPIAQPSPPRFWHESVAEFVRFAALQEELTGEVFDPRTFGEKTKDGGSNARDVDRERVREIMRRLHPAAKLHARALASPADDLASEIPRALEAYAPKQYRREPARRDITGAAASLLRVVTSLPTRRPDAVTAIVAAVDHELTNAADRRYDELAAVLAQDARYYREAEELVRRMLASVRPPALRAMDAVEVLLGSYATAQRIDRGLAHEVFETARELASAIDTTIDAQAVALLGAARRVLDDSGAITLAQANQLAAVVEYGGDMDKESPVERMEDTLLLLARTAPGLAVDLARVWDRDAKLDIALALPAVARGIGVRGDVDPALLVPFAVFSRDGPSTTAFLEEVATFASVDATRRRVLGAWVAYVRRLPRSQRFDAADALIAFARTHACGDESSVASLVAEVGAARERGIPARRDDMGLRHELPADTALATIETLLASAPLEALAELERVGGDLLGRADRIEEVVAALAGSVTSGACARILTVVERWADTSYRAVEAQPLLDSILRAGGMAVADGVRAASARLMSPDALAALPHGFRRRELLAVLNIWRGFEAELFDRLIGALARNLDTFPTDTLYRWIGELARLIPGPEAAAYLDYAAPRAVGRIPTPRTPLGANTDDGLSAVVHAVGTVLGHPRAEYRFRALYAAAELVSAEPASMVGAFLAEVADETHPRWMTRREWALFMFHHVALRAPHLLAVHAGAFAAIATNRTFPHAKHRYHARETVLAIVKASADTLEASTMVAVQSVQQPTKLIKQKHDYSRGRGSEWPDVYAKPFHFNSVDTIPYWYDPLGRVFNVSGWDVATRAMEWIVSKWGLTEAICEADAEADRHEYDWRDMSHDHGSEPNVETLHSYAERHGMFVAAGEMIDSMPVAKERGSIDEWTDWVRYHVREADPALTSRLLGPPPYDPENYGVFAGDAATWRAHRPTSEYVRHLTTDDAYTLVADMEGTFGEHDFDVSVRSLLVRPDTAASLVRAVMAADEPFYAHAQSLHYDTIVPEMEADLRREIRQHGKDDTDEEGGDVPFRLRPTVGQHHQEFEFHGDDPRWKSFSRNYPFPSTIVQRALGLTRVSPLDLRWKNKSGKILVRAELWHDGRADDQVDGAEGYRLLLAKDALPRLLARTGEDLVFIVTMRRQVAYRYRRSDAKDEFDRGTTYAVLASTLLRHG
jgi:hypothetical protein